MSWEKCFVDPCKGVAFFDGIEIIADSITDPRWDRVLPILEEEQVFMCRAMKDLLRPGQLVLDVGTGSGVFAIWAARLGCRVLAIDINPRALRTARENLKRNEITSVESYQDLLKHQGDGAVCIANARFDRAFLEGEFKGPYDFVILAPPYNPTMPGLVPALHADAGLLGQKHFEDQVPWAVQGLKPGGSIIGNQMTPSTGRGTASPEKELKALETLKNELGTGASITYQKILPESMPIEEFLHKQYATHLRDPDQKLREQVTSYIKDCIAKIDHKHFALIYYSARKPDTASSAHSQIQEEPATRPPKRNWDDRTWLHREIVDHTAEQNSFPSPALFMDHAPDARLVPLHSDGHQLSDVRDYNESPMRQLDAYISRRAVLEDAPIDKPGPVFDLIVIDTAPWYGTGESEILNFEELKLWMRPQFASPASIRRILEAWQHNTIRQQKAGLSLFLHPHFIGQNTPDLWSEIAFPAVSGSDAAECLLSDHDDLSRVWDQLQKRRQGANGIALQEQDLAIHYATEHGYSSTRLHSLSVPGNVDIQTEAVETDLSQAGLAAELQTDPSKCFAAHYRLMHQSMLCALHAELPRLLGLPHAGFSTLAGLPLRLAYGEQPVTVGNSSPPTLRNYRGGIWLYAYSSQEWSHMHEAVLCDILRFAWLVIESSYNKDAINTESDFREKVALEEYARGASHTLKGAISAVQHPFHSFEGTYDTLFAEDSDFQDIASQVLGDREPLLKLQRTLLAGIQFDRAVTVLSKQAQMMFWIMDPTKMRAELFRGTAALPWGPRDYVQDLKLAIIAGLSKSRRLTSQDGSRTHRERMFRVLTCDLNENEDCDDFCCRLNGILEGALELLWVHPQVVLPVPDRAVAENLLFELIVNACAQATAHPDKQTVSVTASTSGDTIVFKVTNYATPESLARLEREWEQNPSDSAGRSTGATGLHQLRVTENRFAQVKLLDLAERGPVAENKSGLALTLKRPQQDMACFELAIEVGELK